jgi:PST family polysaccharide transporter
VVSKAQSWTETIAEAKPLLKLGLVFTSTTLMALGTMYLVRVIILRYLGLGAAGMYQAAIALSSVYVGFILDAMGRDFYPRLTAMSQDNNECTSLINKQMEVGLLIAIPGILATMTFAPVVIAFFYSAKFTPAYDVLKWQMLGLGLRVVSWPMGFLLIAKGNGRTFFWTELVTNCVHLCFIWIGIQYFGLIGTGMGFFGMYVFYCILIFWVGKINYKFTLSPDHIRLGAIIITATGIVFLTPYLLSEKMSLLINIVITTGIGLYAIKKIIIVTDGANVIPNIFMKIVKRIGM